MFAELRHNVHVSLCVLARPEVARALLSRHSVALRIQWLSNNVGVGSRFASGACPLRVLRGRLR